MKQAHIFHISFATWFLLAAFPSAIAAERPKEVTDQALKELATQAEEFREPPKEIPKEEEKPEIEVKEKVEEPVPKGPTFFVRKVALEGNKIFSNQELSVYTKRFEGKTISFQDLKPLVKLITNHYRSRGYSASRAYIPPQTIENETVTIRIIEAKVGKVFVENNRYFKDRLYEKSIQWEEDRVFRYQDLETSLYFLGQQPDRKAKGYLIPGEEPQTVDVILKAEEKFPIHFGWEFNNRGSNATHYARHVLNVTDNNVSGFGDSLTASLSLAEEKAFNAASFHYQFPILSTRTTLQLFASITRSKLVKHLQDFDVKGKSHSFAPGITQSLIRTPKMTLDGSAGFEIKDSKTEVLGDKISFDRVRALVVGPRMIYRDRWGYSSLDSDLHLGIGEILGASEKRDENASKKGSGGEFIYFNGNWVRIQRLPYEALAILKAGGQLSNTMLNSQEQFRAGGAFSVRGYPESDSTGDYGFNFGLELRVPPYIVPKDWKIPKINRPIREAVSLVGFMDGAKTFQFERSSPETKLNRLLLGTGFGVRVNFDPYVSLQFDLGFPFGDRSTEKNREQAHVSLRVGF